jgi:hypothetical protein
MIDTSAREYWTRNWRNGETGMLYKKRWYGNGNGNGNGSGSGSGNGMILDQHVNKLYNTLSLKAKASVLIQIRTEKIGLYRYLHKIKRADEP